MAHCKISNFRHGIMATAAVVFLVSSFGEGCQRGGRALTEIVVVEGFGVEGMCHVGELLSDAEKALGRPSTEAKYGDRTSGFEREYLFQEYNLVLDTLPTRKAEEIVRVSLVCSLPGTGSNALRLARTKQGVELLPKRASRQDLIRTYGSPQRSYDSFTSRSIGNYSGRNGSE